MNKLNLGRYIKKYAFLYLIAILAICVSIWLDMIVPLIVQHIVDDVLIARKMHLLNYLLLGFLAVGLGRCVLQYTKEFLCDYSGSKIASEVRINLFKKIQSLSANFFDGINSGELMSRVKDDVDRIWDITAYMGILIIEVIVRVFITSFYMMRINWKLAIIPTICMLLSGIIAIRMERKLDKVYENIAQKNSELNNTAAENLSGVRTVKAFAREDFEKKKFYKHNQKYYELNIEQSKIFVHYNPMVQFITRLLPAFILILGGLLVIISGGNLEDASSAALGSDAESFTLFKKLFYTGKTMSIGELLAFVQYVGNIVWPMEMLGWLTNGFSSAKASVNRLNKIYAQFPDIEDMGKLDVEEEALSDALFSPFDINGDIAFENVSYAVGERYILKDVSFNIKSGQTLGIMGATGSGKTSIINLLKRMYDVTSGAIKIDGVNIKDLPLKTLRRSVACVMQDIFLFSDTIDGNIRLGERDCISKPTVLTALEKAQATSFVDKMSDGIDTVIGERGIGLSGGQKQRITIARALARKAPILVLDDSTSALDSETELEIQNVLASLQGMTKIIIGHRISSVRKADLILVLENGRIAEAGNHQQLLDLGGLYKETFDSQY